MTSIDYEKRVLPLAGMVQAAHLVASIANTGMVSQDTMVHSLKSIFVTNPESISDVYAGTVGIKTGLRVVSEMLVRFNVRDHGDMVRYVFGAMALARKLSRQPAKLHALGARITHIDEQRMLGDGDAGGINDEVIAALAGVYEELLSDIEPRIRVTGRRNHLAGDNIHRIRALLLAAVRSAVLFHQVGGRRWQLLFMRSRFYQALESYR